MMHTHKQFYHIFSLNKRHKTTFYPAHFCTVFAHEKRQYCDYCLFSEKVFLLMGCSKKLYNVLGGFTVIIIALFPIQVCTNMHNFPQKFCALFTHPCRTFSCGSSFKFYASARKSPSNSSPVIFSFSSRRSAQL